jgi:hypothetical protein
MDSNSSNGLSDKTPDSKNKDGEFQNSGTSSEFAENEDNVGSTNGTLGDHKVISPLPSSDTENIPPTNTGATVTPLDLSKNAIENNQASGSTMNVTSSPMSQTIPVGATGSAPKKKGFKKLGVVPLVAIIAVLFMSAGAAAYLGVIRPNNPDNLWNTALSNTAKGMEKVSEYQKNMADSKGAKFSGSFNLSAEDVAIDGSFEGKTYESDSEIKADIGALGSRLNFELLTSTPENANNPDIYFRIKGLEGLSSIIGATDPSIQSTVNTINNQWYVIDHTLLDQASTEATGSELSSTLTQEEINKISDAVLQATNEYVLSSDPNKAVINKTQNVGWEEKDGREMYHYKVTLNKENFKAYLNSNKERLKQLNIKSLEGSDELFDELVKSVDEIKEEEANADVWVDKDTKLMRVIRFSDKNNQETYAEFSINYNGEGDVLPLGVKFVSSEEGSKGELSGNLSLDTKNNTATADLSFKDDKSTSAKFELKAEPNNEELNTAVPTDAKSFYELIGQFGPTGTVAPTGSPLGPLTETLGAFDIKQL